jgi:hypothetical protein
VATRVIIAGHSLWILASRPDLPSVVTWPPEFWNPLPRNLLIRFGYFGLYPTMEWILYGTLVLLLLAVLLGFQLRITAFTAGLLLYHFAPLDSLLASGDFVSMSGLTIPTLMLFLIWTVDAAAVASPDYRWPVVIGQFLLGISFFFSGVIKLRNVGWDWYTGENIRQLALATWSLSGRPAALWLATHLSVSWLVAIGSALLDSLFIVAVFSSRLRWFILPLALIALPLRSAIFGYHWLAAPMLLLFLDWDYICSRCAERRFLRV